MNREKKPLRTLMMEQAKTMTEDDEFDFFKKAESLIPRVAVKSVGNTHTPEIMLAGENWAIPGVFSTREEAREVAKKECYKLVDQLCIQTKDYISVRYKKAKP